MQQPITRQQIVELQQENNTIKLKQQSNTIKLIDIRTPAEYEKMHVPGALSMPAETIAENITEFAANDIIVCICNKGLERSQNAAEEIANMGFNNVFYLEDGTFGWFDDNGDKEKSSM